MNNLALKFDDDWTAPPSHTADVIDLAEARKALDGDFEIDEPASTLRVHSTPETRERYAFLKTKKLGSTWEEQGRLYRSGPTGVTVFKLECFG